MKTLTRAELIELANELVEEVGSQAEVARRLDVSAPAINNALRQTDYESGRYDRVLCDIVEQIGHMTVERSTMFRVG